MGSNEWKVMNNVLRKCEL